MESFWQDLRYSLRTLNKSRGFVFIAACILALGIGACTVVFSIAAALVFPPLPAADPARVLVINQYNTQTGMAYLGASWPDLNDWRAQSRSVEHIAALTLSGTMTLGGADVPELLRGARVSANLFATLGVQPALGRTFTIDEEQARPATVAVLSHALWQRRFAGEPQIIGRTLKLDGQLVSIIGVMPPGFDLFSAQLYVPLQAAHAQAQDRAAREFLTFARLKKDVAVAQARAEFETLARGLAQSYPDTNREVGVQVQTLREWMRSDYKNVALVLFGAVALVLLIACANVAGLLLARGVRRQKEIAVRLALGATRWRLVRQLLTESLALALLGGALGVLLAWWIIDAINATNPFGVRYRFAVDGKVLLLALAVSALTAVLCGLFPALLATKADVHNALKEGATKSASSHRLRNVLVIGEIAVSFLLLVGAGLLLRSAWKFQQIELGFNPRQLLVMWVNTPPHTFQRASEVEEFGHNVLQRLNRLPTARYVAANNWISLGALADSGARFTVADSAVTLNPDDAPVVACKAVTPDYFRALEITVLRGRHFTETDRAGAAPVAIVNERLARTFWPHEDALGKQLKLGGSNARRPWLTIVGVIRDVCHPSFYELSETPLDIYIPFAQQRAAIAPAAGQTNTSSPPAAQTGQSTTPTIGAVEFLVRVDGDPRALKGALSNEVRAVEKELPLTAAVTMEERVARESFERRSLAWLLGVFALVALGLAATGLYGLLAYFVNERTHEIGVRMALGAQPRDVLRLVIGQAMKLALTGIIVGAVAGLALAQVLTSLLYGISARDPLTFILLALLLAGVALLACYAPARRAMQVDPLVALRHE